MKQWQLFSILMVAAVPVASSAGSAWSQTKEGRSGEEKMDVRGVQAPGQMERKKGEEEMEARGAQKPGRMGKSGAESAGSQAERWAAQDVKKVQVALKGKGHNPGSMDGVIGPQTRQAIRAFQNANGLKVTGRLDSETAEKLGIAKASASGASSSAAAKGQASPTEKRPMGR